MKKVFKLILTSTLAIINVIIFIISFSAVIGTINQIDVYNYSYLWVSVFTSSFFAINSFLVIVLCVYLVVKILKPIVSNKAQYTNELEKGD
jgi:hypothetical protein